MKYVVYALILTFALSLTVVAANNPSGSMNLITAGKVNGTNLNAGEYKLTWTGQGNNVQVNIIGKGVKLTAPATIVNNDKNALHDAVVKSSDGSIQEVVFGGKKTVLKFTGAGEASTGK
jgi:hypothetical protein